MIQHDLAQRGSYVFLDFHNNYGIYLSVNFDGISFISNDSILF